jgi:hypothetical protein
MPIVVESRRKKRGTIEKAWPGCSTPGGGWGSAWP